MVSGRLCAAEQVGDKGVVHISLREENVWPALSPFERQVIQQYLELHIYSLLILLSNKCSLIQTRLTLSHHSR